MISSRESISVVFKPVSQQRAIKTGFCSSLVSIHQFLCWIDCRCFTAPILFIPQPKRKFKQVIFSLDLSILQSASFRQNCRWRISFLVCLSARNSFVFLVCYLPEGTKSKTKLEKCITMPTVFPFICINRFIGPSGFLFLSCHPSTPSAMRNARVI